MFLAVCRCCLPLRARWTCDVEFLPVGSLREMCQRTVTTFAMHNPSSVQSSACAKDGGVPGSVPTGVIRSVPDGVPRSGPGHAHRCVPGGACGNLDGGVSGSFPAPCIAGALCTCPVVRCTYLCNRTERGILFVGHFYSRPCLAQTLVDNFSPISCGVPDCRSQLRPEKEQLHFMFCCRSLRRFCTEGGGGVIVTTTRPTKRNVGTPRVGVILVFFVWA